MKDSGQRRTFDTGSVRDRAENKIRPDLIDPVIELFFSWWLTLGAAKYGPGNWAKGQPISEVMASVSRHWLKLRLGVDDEPHDLAIMFGMMQIRYYREMIRLQQLPPEIDDMEAGPEWGPYWESRIDEMQDGIQDMIDERNEVATPVQDEDRMIIKGRPGHRIEIGPDVSVGFQTGAGGKINAVIVEDNPQVDLYPYVSGELNDGIPGPL